MKFTLLFYTDDWDVGPVIELEHVPDPGSVVWTATGRKDEEGRMYYVDNVMYPQKGMDREDVVYLFVRPYEGYSQYAPRTETDRLAEKIDAVAAEIRTLRNEASEMNLRLEAIGGSVEKLGSWLREKQQEIADSADEAAGTLDEIRQTIQRD